jgi:hypothetical protein
MFTESNGTTCNNNNNNNLEIIYSEKYRRYDTTAYIVVGATLFIWGILGSILTAGIPAILTYYSRFSKALEANGWTVPRLSYDCSFFNYFPMHQLFYYPTPQILDIQTVVT